MTAAAKRSLILAGGGLKVAFQAGVLQVWLDEAGLRFDHVDGASGGTFNLAMYCQGMSGTEIVDAWHRACPVGAGLNLGKLLRGDSLLTLDGYRSKIFPRWGLDWDAIRASQHQATFNVCNFTRYELEVLGPQQMSEDMLIACVSLPMWFPPVVIDGQTYVDAVYLTDGNLEEAIRRGADEIWVIWTVSERGEWQPGLVDAYFQTIEIAANGHFRRIVGRIEENNAAIAAGRPGEFGRPIELKILRAEVPVNYIVNVSADRLREAVNRGVNTARQWCAHNGIPLTNGRAASAGQRARAGASSRAREPSTLSFTEEMKGFITLGEKGYREGFQIGRKGRSMMSARLTISIDDVDRFVTDPDHPAAITGDIRCDALGGTLPVDGGTFNLFVDAGDPARKQMRYRLLCHDDTGTPYTVVGVKDVADGPGLDVWADTTTLHTRVLRGHVQPEKDDVAEIAAAGIISIHLLDFLRQLQTFRVGGPIVARPAALARFVALFFGKLWDVYARRILPSGPL